MSDLEQKRREVRQRLIEDNEFPNIPEDWGVERLRFLFTESKERNGKSPVGEMLSVSEYRGVVPREYENEEQKRTDDELENYRVVRPGQLAVNSMWLNHLGLGVSEHTGHVSPAYNVYKISDRLDRRFVHHLMRSNYYLKIYLRYLYGIRPNSFQIKSNDWTSIPIIVPDLPTQRAIADFLDRETARIDLLIEKKHRLVVLLGEKVSAFREAHIANGELTRMKFIADYITSGSRDWGGLYSDEGELFVRIGNVSGSGIDLDLRKKTYVELGDRTEGLRTRLRVGDLLISITADLGSVAVVNQDAKGAFINQHLALVRLRQSQVDPRYVAHAMNTRAATDQFALRGYGGTKQGLSLKDVAEIAIPLPSKDTQIRIASQIDHFSSLQKETSEKINASIDRLKEYRSALITAAVTGQIDVSNFAKSGKTDRFLDKVEK